MCYLTKHKGHVLIRYFNDIKIIGLLPDDETSQKIRAVKDVI